MTVAKQPLVVTAAASTTHADPRDWWLDAARVAEEALAWMRNHDFLGDTIPHVFPNLGPEVFSAFFGMEMDYTADSSWGVPNLHDWAEADKLVFSGDNVYWKKLEEMSDVLLAAQDPVQAAVMLQKVSRWT